MAFVSSGPRSCPKSCGTERPEDTLSHDPTDLGILQSLGRLKQGSTAKAARVREYVRVAFDVGGSNWTFKVNHHVLPRQKAHWNNHLRQPLATLLPEL